MSHKTDRPSLNQLSSPKNDSNLSNSVSPNSLSKIIEIIPPPSKPKQSKWNPFKRLFSKTRTPKIDLKVSTSSGKIETQKKEKAHKAVKGPEILKDSVEAPKELQRSSIVNSQNNDPPENSHKGLILDKAKTQEIPKSSEKSQGQPKEIPLKPSSGDFFSKMSELSLKGDLSKLFKDYEQFFEVLEKPGENGKSMKDLKEMCDDIERRSDVFVQKVEALCKNEKLELDQRNILTA